MGKQIGTILLLAIVALGGTAMAAAESLSIRSDTWPPYNDDPKSIKPGYMIQILWEIYKPHGYDIDYQQMSWTDSLAAVRKGQFNAVVGATREDAPDFIFPKESFGSSDTAFFVKGGNPWKYKGIGSLAKIRLGVIESYSYNDELDAYIKANRGKGKIIEGKGEDALQSLVSMLRKGEIDAIAEDSNVMLTSLVSWKVPLGAIVSAGSHPDKSILYVAFSPKNTKSRELATLFDQEMRELRKNGKLHAILQLYGLDDWKPH